MLKKPCPYHSGSTKHTLEECTILRHFYSGATAKDDTNEPPKDKDNGPEGEGFPKVRNYLLIFRGRTARLTASSERSVRLTQPCRLTSSGRRMPSPSIDETTWTGS